MILSIFTKFLALSSIMLTVLRKDFSGEFLQNETVESEYHVGMAAVHVFLQQGLLSRDLCRHMRSRGGSCRKKGS